MNVPDSPPPARAEVATDELARAYLALLETSHDLVWTVDAEGRWTFVSESARRIYGWEPAEMLGRPFTDFEAPDQAAKDLQTFGSIKDGQPRFGYETLHLRKDGSPVWLSYNAIALRDGEGRVIGTTGTARDITHRILTENALQRSEARFRGLFAAAPDAILIVDRTRTIQQANPAAETMFGYGVGELAGRTVEELVPASLRARHVEHVTAFADRPHARPMGTGLDLRGCRKDGSAFPVDIMLGPLELDGEMFTLCIVRDISKRKAAEDRARHLAAFPELNPNPVLEFDAGGRLVYHNPAAERMAGRLGAADIGRLLPPETPAVVAECLGTGQARLRLETRAGHSTLSWSFYPIAAQRVVHCYVGDITERQQLELQLRQAQKMDAVGQLAGGVAHDFNNLLTAIIGHLGMLRANPQVTPDVAESLAEISAAANRAANLTRQLLTFSRRQVMNVTALDLNEVVTHLTKMLRRLLGEDVAMQLDFAPEQLTFHGDAGLMEQALVNLAVNARDAMPGGGTLRITTRSETRTPPATDGADRPAGPGRYVRLSVSDTGTGIPPEYRGRIFEPFFTTKDVGKGTGLGLATVFGIVQQHNGWIEFESETGRGTVFHLFLPRLDGAPAPTEPAVAVAAPRGRGETILLVEDEHSVQELGRLALGKNGYRVLVAGSGREALEIWAAHKAGIDLLLTDVIMPQGVSGLQLARQLLAEKPALKVIYSSGYSAEIAGKELALTDDVNYLAKPYELDRLFRVVRAVLDGVRHSATPFGRP